MNFTDVNGLACAKDAAMALFDFGFTPIKAVGKKPDGVEWQKTKYTSKDEVAAAFEKWGGRKDVYIDDVDAVSGTTKKIKKNWSCTIGVLTDGYYLIGNNTQESLDAFRAECPFYDETLHRMGKNPYPCALFKRASKEPLKKTKLIRKTQMEEIDPKTKKRRIRYTTLCDLWADSAHFVAWGVHPDEETIRYKFLNDLPPMLVSDEYIFDLIERVSRRLDIENPYKKDNGTLEKKETADFDLFKLVKAKVKMSDVLGTNATRIMCPLHTQGTSNPSAVIYDDREIHCHSNGCHADVISMFAHLRGWNVGEKGVMFKSAKALAEQYDIEIPEQISKYSAARDEPKDEGELVKRIWEYVESCKACVPKIQPDRMRIVNDMAHHFISVDFYLTMEDTQDIFIFNQQEGVYQMGGNQHIRKNYQRMMDKAAADGMQLSKYTTIQTINEIIDTIRRLTMKKRDEIEPPMNLICLRNGIFDTDKMEMQPFAPQYYFFSKLAVSYDPIAVCPEIDKFFLSTLDPQDIGLIEEIAGACLLREDRWQKAICAIGEGSNGKSTLIRMLVEFLGKNNTASVGLQELENDRFATANLYGKHANLVADMAADDLKGTAKFKACTGGDMLRAQNKNGQPFFFINFAKFFISCNRLPKTPDNSLAFFRRLVIIKFSNTFDGNEDRSMGSRITASTELSGFLNRAIIGCKRLKENGHYSYNSNSDKVRELYVHLSDSATAFVNDRLEVNDEEEGISKDEIWNAYLKFCKENHLLRVADKPFWETVRENFMLVEYRPSADYDPLRRRMMKGVKFKKIGGS